MELRLNEGEKWTHDWSTTSTRAKNSFVEIVNVQVSNAKMSKKYTKGDQIYMKDWLDKIRLFLLV